MPAPRQRGGATTFIVGEALVPAEHEGRQGVTLTVRLTNYRSLPLSCIAGIDLEIDGRRIDEEDLVLIVNGVGFALRSLRARGDLTWYVLDPAELFIPLTEPLDPGPHDVFGALHFISPSASAGRALQTGSARAELSVLARKAQ